MVYTQYISCVHHVSAMNISSSILFLGDIDPRYVTNLDPMGVIGIIYVGNHQRLINAKYKSSEPHGFGDYL